MILLISQVVTQANIKLNKLSKHVKFHRLSCQQHNNDHRFPRDHCSTCSKQLFCLTQGNPKTVSSSLFTFYITFRSQEINSKLHCKVCICSVILGQPESSSTRASALCTKITGHFPIPLSIKFSSPKILGFLPLRNIA